jgi:xanthosine utilization system XapX-like protein
VSGAAGGDFTLKADGITIASGTLAANSFRVYRFTVPAPGAIALLGLGGMMAARRRRA